MCYSYNYNIVHLKCELNSKPLSGVDRDFHNDDSCVYVEVDRYKRDPSYDTCIGNRCKEGEVCERLKNGRLFCVKDSCENNKVTNVSNVAFGKTTQADDEHSGHPSSNAVDDDNNTYVHTYTRNSPYWLVDLGGSHVIEKIDLLNTNFEGKF
ncbi:unnamed protein product [Mytilus edulis]|uniref:Uncharacterized protein n=1 Tax=Mytilus edulis TaxID=6550 RepID=A0A8S3SKR1_MYTED|nr:unnamed protein product [Mytilus edulis]